MHRTFSSRRYLVPTLLAAAAAATVPACGAPELPTGVGDKPVVVAEKAPPPISGGTLTITSNNFAVAADPDRDIIWIANLADTSEKPKQIVLNENDEPGRVIEDGAGRVHVALRRGGDIVTFDPATVDPANAKTLTRSAVCPAPRGMAYDKDGDVIRVACAGGELVTMPASGGAAISTLHLEKDIRDVAVAGNNLFLTRFRAAEVLVVDKATGNVVNRQQPPSFDATFDSNFNAQGPSNFVATGAFRMVPLAGGGIAISHQRSRSEISPVVISEPDGYGGRTDDPGGCNAGIVHPTVTKFDPNGNPDTTASSVIPNVSLPVDMAVSPDGTKYTVVAAGSDKVISSSLGDLAIAPGGCLPSPETRTIQAPIAAAYWQDKLIVQTRVPAQIAIFTSDPDDKPQLIDFGSTIKVEDTGHDLFHHDASETSHISCASCHLEGHDDGHTWVFDTIGARRTQTLGGDIFETAPFHWDGDMQNLGAIMDNVFVTRMGGSKQGPRHVSVMQDWMGSIPRLPVSAPVADTTALKHGADLFQQSCASCHAGSLMTNNSNKDVGTGGSFQVPSLIGISNRAPYLHDGSAATLRDRFYVPNADKHVTPGSPKLSDQDVTDLVTYLDTL